MALYGIQMFFKWCYEPLFFIFHKMGLALANLLRTNLFRKENSELLVIVMDVFVTATAAAFYNEDPIAGKLMIPYVLFCYFCTAYTASIRSLNKASFLVNWKFLTRSSRLIKRQNKRRSIL